MRGFPPRATLLAAALLLAACKPEVPAAGPGPAAPAPPPPPPADVAWDPEDLLTLPGEEVAAPGTGKTWIEGIVVDPEGKPVAGAAVEMHAFPRVETATAPLLHASATSGPDGRFRVGPGPSRWWEQGLLSARAPGFARTSLRPSPKGMPGEPSADEGVEARVALRPGIQVRGEVRGEDGGPPDAPVSVWVFGPRFTEVVTTDAAGNFTVTAPAGHLAANVMDGAHPTAGENIEVAPGGENRVRIQVKRGLDVRGRVVDAATGRPIPNAVLRGYWGDSRIVRAGPDGEFTLPRYWFHAFQVRAPGYAVRMHLLPLDRDAARLGMETVRLDPGFTARGRVIGPGGKPMAGVRMRIFERDAEGRWVIIAGPASKPDGSFVFVGLPVPTPEREVRIFATGDEWAVSGSAPLAGTAGAVVDGVEVRLTPLAEAWGRVEDEKGGTVPGEVEIEWDVPKGLERYWPLVPNSVWRRIGDDGRFQALVPEGAALRVRAEGLLFRAGAPVEGKAPCTLALKVHRGLLLKGRVVDYFGDPVTAASVHVAPASPDDAKLSRTAPLDENGEFAVGGLDERPYAVSITGSREFLHEATRGVRAGGEPVTLRARRPGSVSGRLVLPEGVPAGLVPEVTVRALEDSHSLPPVLTRRVAASDRRFTLGPLAPGPYSLHAVAGDWRRDLESIEVTEPGTEVGDLALAPGSSVAGTVRLLGKPAAGVSLEVLRALPNGTAESCGRAETGADGRFRVGGLREGAHAMSIQARSRPVLEVHFVSVAGVATSLDVEVPAGANLAVKVLGADGKPVPGARVTISGPSGGVAYWKEGSPQPGSHATGTDGVLRCSGLPAGALRVSVNLPGGGTGEGAATVADGEDREVEVRLAK